MAASLKSISSIVSTVSSKFDWKKKKSTIDRFIINLQQEAAKHGLTLDDMEKYSAELAANCNNYNYIEFAQFEKLRDVNIEYNGMPFLIWVNDNITWVYFRCKQKANIPLCTDSLKLISYLGLLHLHIAVKFDGFLKYLPDNVIQIENHSRSAFQFDDDNVIEKMPKYLSTFIDLSFNPNGNKYTKLLPSTVNFINTTSNNNIVNPPQSLKKIIYTYNQDSNTTEPILEYLPIGIESIIISGIYLQKPYYYFPYGTKYVEAKIGHIQSNTLLIRNTESLKIIDFRSHINKCHHHSKSVIDYYGNLELVGNFECIACGQGIMVKKYKQNINIIFEEGFKTLIVLTKEISTLSILDNIHTIPSSFTNVIVSFKYYNYLKYIGDVNEFLKATVEETEDTEEVIEREEIYEPLGINLMKYEQQQLIILKKIIRNFCRKFPNINITFQDD